MPFGLCNATATFQRLMDRVLIDLKWNECLIYLDDIVIVGRTFNEHLRHVANVLSHLRQAELKLKPEKCYFLQQEVRYILGPHKLRRRHCYRPQQNRSH